MPYRTTPLVNGEFYHVFNRGVAKMNVFTNTHDFRRFLKTIHYYSIYGPKPKLSVFTPTTYTLNDTKKIVAINTYCLMPNHFHFLLRQEEENGISEFISKVLNSYTKYFNTKYNRVGPLFQGQFKAVRVESNEQLLHVHRYIHLNPIVSYLTKTLETYRWSSYREYVSSIKGICTKNIILDQFSEINTYNKFLNDQIDYGQTLESIKHALIDFE